MLFNAINQEFIFEDDRPFIECHASTLVVLENGDILAAWFGGSKEGKDDVAIWYSRRSNDKWTAPYKVADQDGIPHWNPVLYKAEGGDILLFYKVGHTIPEWYTMVITSSDGGYTWSQPVELVKDDIGGRGPVKNKPVRLLNNTLLAPASIEGEYWDAFTDISSNGGKTWFKSHLIPIDHQKLDGKGIIQPTLWESEPGNVHMLLRSTEGCIYRSDSKDSGQTWSSAYRIDLPNNNSGIDVVKMDEGTLALVLNPVSKNWGPRSPIVLKTSSDNGVTWTDEFVLENSEGEFSYPAIVARGNEVFITYTWKRQRIVYWKIAISK